ncbi:MAG: hypothetical protein ACJAQ1_000634 [Flavobacterium sp.]|jgi:hypothetical protein
MVDLGQKRYAMRTFFILHYFVIVSIYLRKVNYYQTTTKAIVKRQILVTI